jgi:uncharacterized Tic20 family protein
MVACRVRDARWGTTARPRRAWEEAAVPTTGYTDLRASHTDRDTVLERIKDAYARGRLDKTEFDHRMDQVLSARTHADLAGLLRDLPSDPPGGGPLVGPGDTARNAPGGAPGAARSGRGADVLPAGAAFPPGIPDASDRLWGALGHVAGIVSSFVGPLVLYVLVDRRHHHARRHLAEAVNFQVTLLVVTIVTFGLGAIVYAVAWVVAIVAAATALAGDRFRCPYTLRLLR